MHRRRDILILVGLFVVLVLFTILGPGQAEEESDAGVTTTYSSGTTGVLALLRWAQDMGYDGQRLAFTDFAIDPATEALFIINPTEPINRTQAGEVLSWVEDGGTLILVEDRSGWQTTQNQLLQTLELDIVTQDAAIERASVLQPVFTTPPISAFTANTRRVVEFEHEYVAPLAGTDDAPVLVGLRVGEGYVYVSSAAHPFTNAGLRDEDNAALVLNLLREVPRNGLVLFDEYHHGYFTPPSLRTIILGSPWGWALIYSLIVIILYLLLTGRRFGRPIPLREEVALRSSAEYVESMADLFQRGGKRTHILQHYYTAFKRRLARPYGINPGLDDAAFVAQLANYRSIDQDALRSLLARLRRSQIDEQELLRVVSAADTHLSEK